MIDRSFLGQVLDEHISCLYSLMEHIILAEHVHVEIDHVAVEYVVVFRLIHFLVQLTVELSQVGELFFVLDPIIKVIFILLELLLGKLLEICECSIALSVNKVLFLCHLKKLDLRLVVPLQECCLCIPIRSTTSSIQLVTALRILNECVFCFIVLARFFIKLGCLFKMHRGTQVICRPFE